MRGSGQNLGSGRDFLTRGLKPELCTGRVKASGRVKIFVTGSIIYTGRAGSTLGTGQSLGRAGSRYCDPCTNLV